MKKKLSMEENIIFVKTWIKKFEMSSFITEQKLDELLKDNCGKNEDSLKYMLENKDPNAKS